MINKFKNKYLKAFLEKTEGAVTVDFVVLTGAVVLVATFAYTTLAGRVMTLLTSFSIL